ncbi:neck protein [Vibrio phage vB_VpM-pA2SJ1]|uniref:Neck protein n=1 Tax=Vibrio phage vB_VpM-pA2SJ1 TaxID=3095964 RepID=A0AAX4J5C2_9CAUD
MEKILEKYQGPSNVLVGVPKGAGAYEDGTLIAVIAAVNEFGSADGRIPERAALRLGVEDALPQIRLLVKKMLPQLNADEMEMEDLLNLIGELSVGSIQEKISSGVGPANAPSTIKRKGSSTPLIDKGTYRQSIRHVIPGEGEEVEEV